MYSGTIIKGEKMPSRNLTEEEKGNFVAMKAWKFIQQSKKINLVPWVCNKDSTNYDEIKTAMHRGWKEALSEIEEVMLSASREINE